MVTRCGESIDVIKGGHAGYGHTPEKRVVKVVDASYFMANLKEKEGPSIKSWGDVLKGKARTSSSSDQGKKKSGLTQNESRVLARARRVS